MRMVRVARSRPGRQNQYIRTRGFLQLKASHCTSYAGTRAALKQEREPHLRSDVRQPPRRLALSRGYLAHMIIRVDNGRAALTAVSKRNSARDLRLRHILGADPISPNDRLRPYFR